MQLFDFPLFVTLLLLVAILLVIARRLDSRWPDLLKQLNDELLQRMPVYSAETVQRKEAEFIRDRLPKKSPVHLALLLLIVFGAVAWWLTS
jgi:cell division protein FtsL